MMRERSHSSALASNNPTTPKKRLNFFSKNSIIPASREEQASSKVCRPELVFLQTDSGVTPESLAGLSHDAQFLHLRDVIQRIKKAPCGTDPRKVDAAWEVYKNVREEALLLCKSLLQKSRKTPGDACSEEVAKCIAASAQGGGTGPANLDLFDVPRSLADLSNGRNTSFDFSALAPMEVRSSNSYSTTSTSAPSNDNGQWLSVINNYKAHQVLMLENLRGSLLATYKVYEPNPTSAGLEAFLQDKVLRKNLISKWRGDSMRRMRSEKLLFWEQYNIRSLNYERLILDLQDIEKFSEEVTDAQVPNAAIKEYVVAKNGDTILEFAKPSRVRFRVSSHLLAEASPFFAQFLSPRKQDPQLDMIDQLPPPPSTFTCADGTEVKLYWMPQRELNKDEAFTTMLCAAHMQHSKVPRQIKFPAFVSIADVCLRYQCTSPLELQVEYQWLPQWIHLIGDENIDGFLLISYAFGLRTIFTRMSKSAILNAVDEDEIQSKVLWPQDVRDRIKAVRAAKITQVNECCTKAINEYFRPPAGDVDQRTNTGSSFQFTSVPRCPRNNHLCDATNLGWLMLMYNELQLLPGIFKDDASKRPSPKRSLKELVDCLRLISNAPQVHAGICSYSDALRSDINDISNSVSGLTLGDVSGKNGWALSKHAGPVEDRYSDFARASAELKVPLVYEDKSAVAPVINRDISLRILSHIDDMDDLNSAAMVDKTFYQAYKQNEAALLKSVMRAERRRTASQVDRFVRLALGPKTTIHVSPESTTLDRISSGERLINLREVSSPFSSGSLNNTEITTAEAHKIMWPNEPARSPKSGSGAKPNEKFLVGETPLMEDKTRIRDNEKHLRDEKDEVLGGFI